jgi:hypothetical protein
LDGFVKQQRLVIVLVVLLVVAGLVWFSYFKTDSSALTANASSNDQDYKAPPPVENPELHKDRIEAARKTEYKSAGRNIFVAQAAAPVVVAQSQPKPKPLPYGPQPPVPDPPPPPLTLPPNMKFYGYGTVPNGTGRRAFLTDAEEIYVVPEGGLLLNRFRIIKVGNATLEFEEVSTGRRGTAPLEEQAAPSGPSA